MAIDAQWSNVVLFMPMDSDGIVDVKNHTPTLVGGVTVSATQSLTGGYSAYFDGTDDRITFPASADWDMSGGTFSFEFSIRPDALPSGATCRLFMIGANGSASALTVAISTAGSLYMVVPSGSPPGATTATGVVVAGVWNRFEISVNAGQARIFKDGSLVAGPTAMTLPTSSSSNQLYIGWDTVSTVDFKYAGYFDRARITKGSYRNIAAFTSDDNPFPRPTISGTVYDDLAAPVARPVVAVDRKTAQTLSGTISDSGTGAYTIYPPTFDEVTVTRYDDLFDPVTDECVFDLVARPYRRGSPGSIIIDSSGHAVALNNNASIGTTLSPFVGAASISFDGSGDSVSSTSVDYAIGLGDFSIEFWYRPINGGHGATEARVFQIGANSTNGSIFCVCENSDSPSKLRLDFYSGSYLTIFSTTAAVSNNTWHAVQIRRIAGVWTIHVDEALQGTSGVTSYDLTQTALYIGSNTSAGDSFYGNVGPFRIHKGPRRASQVTPLANFLKPLLDGGSGENAIIYDRVIPG